MGTRVKNFESTGIAPNGRLYAGDLNAIQDQYADQSNFAQTIDLANLRLGDTSIQLVKYATAEARLSASLRTDGILRGLGGLALMALTEAQRDALTVAQRPYGLLFLNTTYNRLEWNSGTAENPGWTVLVQGTAPDPEIIGVIKLWTGDAAPAGYLLCDGTEISRTSFANLFNVIGAKFGAGNGSTTFNLPDFRGRVPAGKNTANPQGDHGAVGNNDGASVATRRVRHRHVVNDPGHTHDPSGRYYRDQVGPGYGTEHEAGNNFMVPIPGAYTGISVGPQTGYEPVDTSAFLTVNFIIKV